MSSPITNDVKRQQAWLHAILDSAAEVSQLSRGQGLGKLLWAIDPALMQQSEVASFRQAGAKMLSLLNDVLDLAKMDAGRLELDESDFDVKAVLDETLELVAAGAQAKNLTLRLNVSADTPHAVSGDARRLKQTLANCLQHAIAFMPAGEIRIAVRPDGFYKNQIRFEMTGPAMSIPDERAGEIFCDFNPGDLKATGLDLCYKLVQRMGGDLRVVAGPGKSSAIHLDLVFDSALQEDEQVDDLQMTDLMENPPESQPGKAKPTSRAETTTLPFRVLIAEDSEDSRFLLQEFLKRSSYSITFAENGKLALEASRSRSFDLILMDIQMPVMDGLTATRLIRQEEQASGKNPIPLLALTANARKTDIELSRAAGCNAHLLKPISRQDLLNTIQKYVPAQAVRDGQPFMDINIPEGMEEAAERYLKSRTKELPRLTQLVAEHDFEQLRMLAHNMKGTGTSYGFPDLTRLGAQMETAAKEQDEANLAGQMLELSRYLDKAGAMLSAELVLKS